MLSSSIYPSAANSDKKFSSFALPPFPRMKSSGCDLLLQASYYTPSSSNLPKLPTFDEMFGDLVLENPVQTTSHSPTPSNLDPQSMESSSYSDLIWTTEHQLLSPSDLSSPSSEKRNKRPRRKFHEVQRFYSCNYPGCDKAFGALNHLNAHVKFKNHGPRRSPREFSWVRRSLFPSYS
jgi:hypothetical protein